MSILKLWFPAQPWGTGVGDHIHLMSVVPHWQRANPGGRVIVAYQMMPSTAPIFNFPGVEYIECAEPPDSEFIHAYDASPGSPRSAWWTRLGLDYFAKDKRYWYFPTDAEREQAERAWGDARLRVVLQNRGGMHNKIWAPVPRVVDLLSAYGVKCAVIDAADEVKPEAEHLRIYRPGIRETLAIVGAAHLFVGFDSGPFYAALGTDVPCIGLFPFEWATPEGMYYPVCTPRNIALCVAPDELPAVDLCESIYQMLAPHGLPESFMDDAEQWLGDTKAHGWTLWANAPGTDSELGWNEHEAELEPHFRIEHGVLVDVGAHVGRYTIRAALRGVHVHAFEPNPQNRELLERNLWLNGPLPNVAVYPHALGAAQGEITLSERGGQSSALPKAAIQRGDAAPYTVPLARLDDFAFERIDLLKIDVEGFEVEVLQGGIETIRKHRPRIVVEGHGGYEFYGGGHLTRKTRAVLQTLQDLYHCTEVKPGDHIYFVLTPRRFDPR